MCVVVDGRARAHCGVVLLLRVCYVRSIRSLLRLLVIVVGCWSFFSRFLSSLAVVGRLWSVVCNLLFRLCLCCVLVLVLFFLLLLFLVIVGFVFIVVSVLIVIMVFRARLCCVIVFYRCR